MSIPFCMAWLLIAGGAAGAEPADPDVEAARQRVQTVIDDVEKACLDRTVCMIGRKKAERLAELARRARPELVVECGTALGYSGLWIARELKTAGRGRLVTVEISPDRAKEAAANFRRAGLEEFVTVKVGDARKVVKTIEGPIDFLFVDCGYANYHPILVKLQKKLRPGALVVADNVGIGADGMNDYLRLVRSKFQTRTEWFNVELPWAERDGMEVTVISDERQPFLDWPEEQERTFGEEHAERSLAGVADMTEVRPSTYDDYLARSRKREITAEAIRDGYVYYAIQTEREVPVTSAAGSRGTASVCVTERYRAAVPATEKR